MFPPSYSVLNDQKVHDVLGSTVFQIDATGKASGITGSMEEIDRPKFDLYFFWKESIWAASMA